MRKPIELRVGAEPKIYGWPNASVRWYKSDACRSIRLVLFGLTFYIHWHWRPFVLRALEFGVQKVV